MLERPGAERPSAVTPVLAVKVTAWHSLLTTHSCLFKVEVPFFLDNGPFLRSGALAQSLTLGGHWGRVHLPLPAPPELQGGPEGVMPATVTSAPPLSVGTRSAFSVCTRWRGAGVLTLLSLTCAQPRACAQPLAAPGRGSELVPSRRRF